MAGHLYSLAGHLSNFITESTLLAIINTIRPMGDVSLDISIRWLSSRISEIVFPCFQGDNKKKSTGGVTRGVQLA
jgi:hypothetical protein